MSGMMLYWEIQDTYNSVRSLLTSQLQPDSSYGPYSWLLDTVMKPVIRILHLQVRCSGWITGGDRPDAV